MHLVSTDRAKLMPAPAAYIAAVLSIMSPTAKKKLFGITVIHSFERFLKLCDLVLFVKEHAEPYNIEPTEYIKSPTHAHQYCQLSISSMFIDYGSLSFCRARN